MAAVHAHLVDGNPKQACDVYLLAWLAAQDAIATPVENSQPGLLHRNAAAMRQNAGLPGWRPNRATCWLAELPRLSTPLPRMYVLAKIVSIRFLTVNPPINLPSNGSL